MSVIMAGGNFVGSPSYIGLTSGTPVTPTGNNYVAEDGTTDYVAEDGSTFYVQET